MLSRKLRRAATAILVYSFLLVLPQTSFAQSKPAREKVDLSVPIARIEAALQKRQKELGIPGLSLAIVKDGEVVLSKGYGYKDFENKVPITENTQLAIGSATKAFTALSVLMLNDEGKLSIDARPVEYLPYFRINNPETNQKIQVRDLLSHSSGLNRTDLAMITGKLNREQLIRVAGEAKPMSGLREKFYYQNIMFAAAGEIVAKVSGMPWEKFVPQRIFAPLGMNNSSMSIKEMNRFPDTSNGYIYNFDSKQTTKLPHREIAAAAPAGSINSSANDMAKWLRFVLGRGEIDGKRLISEKSFDEWTKTQMKITPDGSVGYGFGWFVMDRQGKKVVQHGGNIDGFNSMVAMLPEANLGFVLLTNVSASTLGNEMMEIVFSNLADDPNSTKADAESQKEVGKYLFPQAGFDVDVMIENGKLVLKVPNQPTYTLVRQEGRKYALGGAPSGFFITFKDNEAFLEQPQGSFTLPKAGAKQPERPADEQEKLKSLVGDYQGEASAAGGEISIKDVDGKISLVVEGQPPYPLVSTSTPNEFRSPVLPESYSLVVILGTDKKPTGITLKQPQGNVQFKRKGAPNTSKLISADELISKTIVALGGEENLRKITSRTIEFDLNAVNQGVKGTGVVYSKAPALTRSKTTLKALGKKIGWIDEVFDGTTAYSKYSFSEPEEATGKRLIDLKFGYALHPFFDLKERAEKIEVLGKDKFEEKDVWILAITPKGGSRVIFRIDAESYLPLKRSGVVVSSTSSVEQTVSDTYSDYRKVDGIMIPFTTVSNNPNMGDIISTVRKIKHNKKISDSKFKVSK